MSKKARSALMARIQSRDTKPEHAVRKVAHGLGMRFRLHRKELPGSPDLVFPKLRLAVFVHGCFWHRHEGCALTASPKTRSEFWQKKFNANVARDQRVASQLSDLGWRVGTIWECQTRDPEVVGKTLMRLKRKQERKKQEK